MKFFQKVYLTKKRTLEAIYCHLGEPRNCKECPLRCSEHCSLDLLRNAKRHLERGDK